MTASAVERPGADAPTIHKKRPSLAPWPVQFYRTAVGKKWVMALTGIGLIGFVLAHLVGNLKAYIPLQDNGQFELDEYGHTLRTLLYPIMPNGVVLWILRIGLILMFAIHLHSAYTLTLMNKRSRPVGYQSPRDYIAADFASRTMRYTGIIFLAYLIFHLLDLTGGKTGAAFEHGHVQSNLVESLSRPWVAIIYIIGNLAVAIHLYHGTWSLFQSLGLNNPRYNNARRLVAIGISGLVGVVNILFPIMILAGVITD